MQKLFITMLVASSVLVGCSFLANLGNKIAPSQVDTAGNAILGTHKLTPLAKDVGGAIPYGMPVLLGFSTVWNLFERARANRNGKGLIATIKAIKQASEDPEMKAAWETLRGYLSNAHDSADVTPLIKDLLAKV